MGHYNTFVVRIWSDNGRMHGTIQPTGSHERMAFVALESILPFIRDHLHLPESTENKEKKYSFGREESDNQSKDT